MDSGDTPIEQTLQIEVPDDQLVGTYANFVAVSHQTPHDLTIDFCQIVPNTDDKTVARVVSRIRVAPSFLMPLMQALSQHLSKYEQSVKLATEGEDVESD